MSKASPTGRQPDEFHRLVVMAGPDRGRRIVLSNFPVVVGRGSSCGLKLHDGCVSREHLLLSMTDEGVTLDVLSSSGVRVEGKRHRKGRRLLLAGGDEIALGETRLALVDPGQEPPAIETVRTAELDEAERPEEQARGRDEELVSPSGGDATSLAGTMTVSTAVPGVTRKSRKMWVLISLYVLALVAVGVAVKLKSDRSVQSGEPMAPVLSDEQIRSTLLREQEGVLEASELNGRLDSARRNYASRHIAPGAAYRTIRDYLAYKAASVQGRLPHTSDLENFNVVVEELTGRLIPLYRRATTASRQRRYASAVQDFKDLLEMVPDQSDPLNRNLQAHLAYAKKMLAAQRATRRRSRLE